jgi:hypothetical protein
MNQVDVIRAINSCWEASLLHRAFKLIKCVCNERQDLPLDRRSDMFFRDLVLSRTLPIRRRGRYLQTLCDELGTDGFAVGGRR